MNDEVPSSNQYSPLTPVETWIKALTQPREEAYLAIVNDPGASLGKAAVWLAISGFVGGLISGIFSWIFGGSMYMGVLLSGTVAAYAHGRRWRFYVCYYQPVQRLVRNPDWCIFNDGSRAPGCQNAGRHRYI